MKEATEKSEEMSPELLIEHIRTYLEDDEQLDLQSAYIVLKMASEEVWEDVKNDWEQDDVFGDDEDTEEDGDMEADYNEESEADDTLDADSDDGEDGLDLDDEQEYSGEGVDDEDDAEMVTPEKIRIKKPKITKELPRPPAVEVDTDRGKVVNTPVFKKKPRLPPPPRLK